MLREIRIGLVGFGGAGKVHAQAYQALPALHTDLPFSPKIVFVASGSPEGARAAGEALGARWTTDFMELVSSADVDVVDIATPNYLHRDVVLGAIAAGKPVYCEKPLGSCLADSEEILAASRRTGIGGQVAFEYRCYPALGKAKEIVDSGSLGAVLVFRGAYLRSSWVSRTRPASWKTRRAYSGGGALSDLGSHVLDLMTWLLGDISEVSASMDTLIEKRPGESGPEPVEVEDVAYAVLFRQGRPLGTLETSRLSTGIANELRLEIHGDRGALKFSSQDPSALRHYDWTKDSETTYRFGDDFTSNLDLNAESQKRFLDSFSRGSPYSPDLAHAAEVDRIIEACYRSAAEGNRRPVDIGRRTTPDSEGHAL